MSFKSRLMYMSWEIQRKKKLTRSGALSTAWLVYNLEDITVFYLHKKLKGNHGTTRVPAKAFSLFN